LNSPENKKTDKSIRILIVDDHLSARQLYSSLLRDRYSIAVSASGEEALKLAQNGMYDLYITDLMMPGMDGITFIKKLRKIHPGAAVIVCSQTEEIDMAIAAFRQNPLEFLRKPVRKGILMNTIERTLELNTLRENVSALNTLSAQDPSCPEPVRGTSPVMTEFWEKVKRTAEMKMSVAVLITGESGCGKEVVARQLHKWSNRRHGPFIPVNCGLMTSELAGSELLGINKGIATGVEQRKGKFVLADGGAVFLDEIAELPPAVQPMLLRVLQERIVTPIGSSHEIPVDVLVMAATNKHLGTCVADGLFREDLFYRLSVVTLDIPPLRQRKQDIPDLLLHLYRRHGGVGSLPLSSAELNDWKEYAWPGNIRQLENALINRIIMNKPIKPEQSALDIVGTPDHLIDLSADISWSEIRKKVFRYAIKQAGGNVREAARKLNIPKSTLWEYHKKQQ
jgi:DNA-binding NtrC family response regulator